MMSLFEVPLMVHGLAGGGGVGSGDSESSLAEEDPHRSVRRAINRPGEGEKAGAERHEVGDSVSAMSATVLLRLEPWPTSPYSRHAGRALKTSLKLASSSVTRDGGSLPHGHGQLTRRIFPSQISSPEMLPSPYEQHPVLK